jgi:hypothetical protein
MADGRGGELSVEKTGLSVSRPSTLLSAFGTNTDGGTLLRLWERRGKSVYCKVALPEGLSATSLQAMDLRGRPAGEKIKYDKEPVRG